MKSIVRVFVLAAAMVASHALAQDQIRWAPDYQTACQLAADQHRLVLLHFYNDNCEPCVRVERNVFSQSQVAEAVATNFHAVKVHAGKDPQLANRYRVRSWPTDVFVTPTGLEVYRSISPQKPDDYISLVNQVAQQTGVSNSRQWASKLGEAASPVAAAASADQAASGVRQATDQAAVTSQDNFIQGQQRWTAALEQFKAASDDARSAASQTTQDFMAGARQAQSQAESASQQLSQQATDAVNRYEKQGGEAYRQFRDQAAQANEHAQQQAQQVTADARGAVQQYAQTAQTAATRWQQTFSQTAQAPAAAGTPISTTPTPTEGSLAPLSTAPFTTAPPLLPTNNPWLATPKPEYNNADSSPSAVAKPAVAEPVAPSAPPLLAQAAAPPAASHAKPEPPTSAPPAELTTPAPTSLAPSAWQSQLVQASPPPVAQTQAAPPPAAQPATQPPAARSPAGQPSSPDYRPGRQMVDAAKAPPIAMDGFCPVTLLETVARDPHDRAAWKKGNVKFGAIHRNRTYLFTSAEQQQKFLAEPDVYAPMLSGCDPVVFAERGELLDGKRAYGLITPDKRIFLFADEAALRKFNQSPGSYAAAAQQAMLREAGHFYR